MFYGNSTLVAFFTGSGFSNLFTYLYGCLIIFAVVISLAGPLDKAIGYFRVIGFIFAIITICSLYGISTFLISTGFYPEEQIYVRDPKNPYKGKWVPQGVYNFSILTLCGLIMLSVYLLPLVLRPLDFLLNFRAYVIGMISYICLLPTFITLM